MKILGESLNMMTGEVVRTPGKSVKRRIKEQYSVIT